MPTTRHCLALLSLLIACGGTATNARPSESFCELVTAGKLDTASEVAHAALMNGRRGALVQGVSTQPDTHDDGGVVGEWLRRQGCVARVTVPTGMIETQPPIREISFILAPDASGAVRECVVDLKLAPGSPLGIHPRESITDGTGRVDSRCTKLPGMPPTVVGNPLLRAPCPDVPPPPPPHSATAWAWARAIAPELDTLVADVSATPANAPSWKPDQKLTMYAPKDWIDDGIAKTCVPITMMAQGTEWHAFVTTAGTDAPKLGCRLELVLGGSAELVDAGCPSKSGPGGIIGDGRVLGHDLVIEDDGTLAYDDVPVAISPSCRWITVERPGCAERTCRSCQISLQPSAGTAHAVGFGPALDPAPVVEPNACEPCPLDHNAAAITQLAEILRGRTFQHRMGGGVHFSPTKTACEARAR